MKGFSWGISVPYKLSDSFLLKSMATGLRLKLTNHDQRRHGFNSSFLNALRNSTLKMV